MSHIEISEIITNLQVNEARRKWFKKKMHMCSPTTYVLDNNRLGSCIRWMVPEAW